MYEEDILIYKTKQQQKKQSCNSRESHSRANAIYTYIVPPVKVCLLKAGWQNKTKNITQEAN